MKLNTTQTFPDTPRQQIPESLIDKKHSLNPFRYDYPKLFSPSKEVVQEALEESSSFEDSLCDDVDEFSEPLSKAKPYQTVLTPEIQVNFQYMDQILPALPCEIEIRQFVLPPSKKKCLALDLDETLIHSLRPEFDYSSAGIQITKYESLCFVSPSGEIQDIAFIVRPFAIEFLKNLCDLYEIVIYTSSSAEYAESIAKVLDPEKKMIAAILSRKQCIQREGVSLKDLRLLKGKDLSQVIIIDNTIAAFSGQVDNGIYIPSFWGEEASNELEKIYKFLVDISDVTDVRPYVISFAGIVRLHNIYKEMQKS